MNANKTKKEVLSYIEKNESKIVDFLAEYIKHPSVNPDLEENTDVVNCQRWLAEKIKSYSVFDKVDFWIEREKYANVVALSKGSGSGQSIMFAGHTDTVPVTLDQEKEWHRDRPPFSGAVKDGKVWGRGATDMKGGNVAAIMAVAALANVGVKLSGDILLTFCSSEESGNRSVGVDSIIARGYKSPVCIVMEASNMKLMPAIQGEFYFRLKITGKSSHIASRHLCIYPSAYEINVPGVNAIEKMIKYLQRFQEIEREWGIYQKHPLMYPGAMTLNISKISGGETFSSLAETCEVVGSVLYNPALDRNEAIGEFKSIVDCVTNSDYWLRQHPPELELPYFLPDKPPVNTPPNHDLCKALYSSIEFVVGSPPELKSSISTSDGNYIADHGIDVITFGPGDFDMGAHGTNEYVPVDQVIDCTKILALTLIDWCGLID